MKTAGRRRPPRKGLLACAGRPNAMTAITQLKGIVENAALADGDS